MTTTKQEFEAPTNYDQPYLHNFKDEMKWNEYSYPVCYL